MMKKCYYILFLLFPILTLVGCQDEGLFHGSDELVTLSYSVSLDDEAKSRAIGDGSHVNLLLVGIFQDGEQLFQKTFKVENNQANITLELLKNQTYQLVFWAQTENNGIYNTDDLSNITINYNNFSKTQTEAAALDAFYATRTVSLESPGETTVTLTRPFTQFGIGVYGNDVEKEKIASAEIKISGTLYTAFKPLAEGEKAEAGEASDYTFTFTELNDKTETFTINGKDYTLLTTNYFLAPTVQTGTKVSGHVSLKDADGTSVSEFDFTDAPLVLNTRINIGKGLTEVWDGVIVEQLPEADSDGIIHIENTQQLAYFIKHGVQGTSEAIVKVQLDKDLDMNADFIARDANYAMSHVSFDGDGNTLYRLGNALFGNATNITVENLNIESASVSETGHVGVLVNTMIGNGTFTGISISNSSAATTDGAAGGMIGYIVRNSETERSESLEVKIENCIVSQTYVLADKSKGQFVGLLSGYDNGEKLIFSNCAATDVNVPGTYSNFLGDETYRRGYVVMDDNRFMPKWDGTSVEPLLANTTYDSDVTAGTNKYVVYSPFDLAGVKEKTASPAAIYLRADIDMNGQGVDGKFNVPSNFTQSACSSTDDNVFDPFSYVTTLDGKKSDTENYSIYNLSISQIEQERAAFILYASGTTVHKNINFRNCQTVAVHKPVTTDAKAYGAILVSNVDATYTMENVHAYDCKVFALQKVGTLGARISGNSTLKNNSVNNCYVENYECKISERFSSGQKTIGSWTVTVYADFYPYGEVGGMYGFIQGNSILTGCKINGTTIYAFGQDDKMATVDGNFLAKLGIAALGYYKVPGRHVSTLIGNIRATGTVTLTDCSVDTNTKCTKRHDKHNSTYNYIGQAYIVKFVDSEGSVTVDGKKLTLADCNKNTRL